MTLVILGQDEIVVFFIMWVDRFVTLRDDNPLLSGMLEGRMPITEGDSRLDGTVVERASGVLAARSALSAARGRQAGRKKRLNLLVPNATQMLGRYLTVGLLIADFVHRDGSRVPQNEVCTLVRGDLLFVTQNIRRCIALLRNLRLGTLRLTDYWRVEVLSRYSRPVDGKPRVFVANPGWWGALPHGRRFGAVVIDASHPRTARHLPALLGEPSISAAPLQIAVVPPWEEGRLEPLLNGDRDAHSTWVWDPAAAAAVEGALLGREVRYETPGRTVWICDDEPVAVELERVHDMLVGAARLAGGRLPAPALEAWSIYHRLRQLVPPLLHVEEERNRSYRTLPLRERLRQLSDQDPQAAGALGAYLDATWPRLVETLEAVYELLLRRAEPAKFYGLAGVVSEHLERSGPDAPSRETGGRSLRVVVPTEHEANLLTALVGDLVDGWAEALQDGTVTLSTAREEPRLVAEGLKSETVLVGFRTSEARYLYVYPDVPIHVVAYPYEASVDGAVQARCHSFAEELQADERRSTVLRTLLPESATYEGNGDRAPLQARARVSHRLESGIGVREVRAATPDAVEPLAVESIAGLSWSDEIPADGVHGTTSGSPRTSGPAVGFVEIVDEEGERIVYSETQPLDVYFAATERLERIPAREVREGMLLVVLVDDRYEGLFQRFLEASREQQDPDAAVALALWHRAKQVALMRHGGNRRALYRELEEGGLSVNYEAVACYYAAGEKEVLAPDRFDDFRLLAEASGTYTADAHVRRTFGHVRTERVARRTCGRLLHGLLRRLAGGAHYEAALTSANVLGTPVEQVAAAVSLREVSEARPIGNLADLKLEQVRASGTLPGVAPGTGGGT